MDPLDFREACKFSAIPDHVLSKIFTLSQNPNVALVNKRMYYVSQEEYTVSEYILQYVNNNTQNDFSTNLDRMVCRFERLSITESIGILVLKKSKGLKYKETVELALMNGWCTVLKALFGMYVLVERDTLRILYKNTTFIEKGKMLDIGMDQMDLCVRDVTTELSDITVSENICVKPLVATKDMWAFVSGKMVPFYYKTIVKALLDVCENMIGLPLHSTEFNEKYDISLRVCKAISCYLLSSAEAICIDNDTELLTRTLNLTFDTHLTLKEIFLFEEFDNSFVWEFADFIREYEYGGGVDRPFYSYFLYNSIMYMKRGLISNCGIYAFDATAKQMAFDMAIHLRKTGIAKKMFSEVKHDTVNVNRLAKLAYETSNYGLAKRILKTSGYKIRELDENILKTICMNGDYESAHSIINDAPERVSGSSLLDAIKSGNTRLVGILIDLGLEIAYPGFMGIKVACRKKNIDMVRFLIRNGALPRNVQNNGVLDTCLPNDHEILDLLLSQSCTHYKSVLGDHVRTNDDKKPRFTNVLSFFITDGLECSRVGLEIFKKYIDARDVNGIKSFLNRNSWLPLGYTKGKRQRFNQVLVNIAEYIIHDDSSRDNTSTEENSYQHKSKYRKIHDGKKSLSTPQCMLIDDSYFQQATSKLTIRDFELLDLLIENGADINSHNFLVLRTAYKAGNIWWIEHFISKNAKVGTEEFNGINEACESGKIEVLKHLIGFSPPTKKETIYNGIRAAVGHDNFEMVKLLVEKVADLSDSKYNGIREACASNNEEMVKYLFKNGASLGRACNTGLSEACLLGNAKIVKILIDSHVDLKYTHANGINEACTSNSLEIVKLLTSAGAKLDGLPSNGVYEACKNNNLELVRFLLQHGAQVGQLQSVINYAAEVNNLELVKLLLQYGAQIHKEPYSGTHEACKNDNLEMLRLLCKHGAKITPNPYCGMAEACKNNNLEMVCFLLRKNPSLVSNADYGIREVCKNRNTTIARALVKHGVNVNAHNGLLLKFAYKTKDVDLVEFLLSYDPQCSKNFVRRLKRDVANGARRKGAPDRVCALACRILTHLKEI